MAEVNGLGVAPQLRPYRYEVKLQVPFIFLGERDENGLPKDPLSGKSPRSFQHELKTGRDTISTATNLLSANRLFYSAAGQEGRDSLGLRVLQLAQSEFFVLYIHEQGHTLGGDAQERGFTEEELPFERGNIVYDPFPYLSGLEATQVARDLMAANMARNGANPADVSAYALASLDNAVQALSSYWRDNGYRDMGQHETFIRLLRSGNILNPDDHGEYTARFKIDKSFNYDRRLALGLAWQAIDPLAIACWIRTVQGLASDSGKVEDIPAWEPFGPGFAFLLPSTTFELSPLGNFEYSADLRFRIPTPGRTIGGKIYGRVGGFNINEDNPAIREWERSQPWGFGARVEHVPLFTDDLYLNLAFHYWDQPPLLFPHYTHPSPHYQTILPDSVGQGGHGGALEAELGFQVTDNLALEVGAFGKDEGWLRGLPYSQAARFTLGASLRF